MGLFDQFPYTNFHELNLDWILESLRELERTIEQFVSINALKYADPIQWNIVSQYEKNTIVIDPLTGTAYISVQPVPSGVALTNADYWTVVFDLGAFVVRAAKNFTDKWEAETTNTATFSTPAGDWLIWGDTLYKALVNITAGDQYVVDSNIQHFTMEDVIGHLEDLSTTDKSNLVAAINEVLTTLVNTAGDLTNLSTTDKSNLVAAINEVLQTLTDTTGDLADLDTTDKSNLVAAINENTDSISKSTFYVTPEMFGAVGDGITDDYQAIQNAIDSGRGVFLSREKSYLCSQKILITHRTNIYGNGAEIILNDSNIGLEIDINALTREEMYAGIIDNVKFSGSAPVLVRVFNATKSTIQNCYFNGFTGEALHVDNDCYEMHFDNLRFFGGAATSKGIVCWSNDIVFENIYLCDCHTGIESHCNATYFNNVHGWILTPAYLAGSKLLDVYDTGYYHPLWLNDIYNDTYMYGIYIQSHQLVIVNGFYNLINYTIWGDAGDPTGYVLYYATGDYDQYTFRFICHDIRVSGKAELNFCNVTGANFHGQIDWDGADNVYLTTYTDYFVDDWDLVPSTGSTIAENHCWRDNNFLHINAVINNSGTGYTALFELPYWLKQYIKDNMYIPCDISSTQYDTAGDMERCYGYMGTNGVYTAQMKAGMEWVTVNFTIPVRFLQNT